MQNYPPHKYLSLPKELSSNENPNSKGELTNSFMSNNTINTNLQGFDSRDSRRKTSRNEDIDDSSGKEISELSMTYSPSNPTKTNTLSNRGNLRNINSKIEAQNNIKAIDFTKVKDYKQDDGMMNASDANESQSNEFESKRDLVYMPLELAKYQIKTFEEEMKQIGDKHSNLIADLEKNNKTLENETEQYYDEILDKWREAVKEKLLKYRRNYERVINERNQTIEELHNIISQLEKQNANLGQEKEELSQNFALEVETFERQKNEAVKSLEENYKRKTQGLIKEKDGFLTEIQNLKTNLSNIEKKSNKEIGNLETFNKSLQANNKTLEAEIVTLKDQLSKEIASLTLDNICRQIESESALRDKDHVINNHKSSLSEFKAVIDKLSNDYGVLQETHEAFKAETLEKSKVSEEKIHQLKVMLSLERPRKSISRSTTPIDSGREAKTPDMERSPNNIHPSQRHQEEEKSRLEISATNISALQPLGPLIDQIEDLIKKKEKVDSQIKAWIQEFRRNENRYPTDVDKQPIKQLYQQHRVLKKQIEAVRESMIARDTNARDTSILQTEPDDKNSSKSKSMSPRRAQQLRNNNPNITNLSINASTSQIINTSHDEQSILPGASFYPGSGLPMSSSGEVVKLRSENRLLREELNQIRLQAASKFEESDAVSQLKLEVQTLQKDKKFLKEKVVSLTRSMKTLQNTTDTSIIAGVEELERKSFEGERYRSRLENENHIKEMESKHTAEVEGLKLDYNKKIADIIKAKDIIISNNTQENQAFREENGRLLIELDNSSQEIEKIKDEYLLLKQEVEDLKAIKSHLEARIRTEIAQRKKLHNIVEDMKGKVRCFVE